MLKKPKEITLFPLENKIGVLNTVTEKAGTFANFGTNWRFATFIMKIQKWRKKLKISNESNEKKMK